MLALLGPTAARRDVADEIEVEAVIKCRVAARLISRKLIDEPWVMTPPDSANYAGLEEAFRVRGLNVPKASLITDSVPLRANLVANGPYLSVFTTSGLRSNADHAALRELPVELPRPNPIGIITLKKRTLSPVVERFIECARKVAKSREKVK